MKREKTLTVLMLSIVAVIALIIRLLAARESYPCCGDAGHFVQHGVALSNGLPGSMSTYWSQGMIALASIANSWNLDPCFAMQWTTIVSGTLVAIFLSAIALRSTGSRWIGLFAGLFCASNSTFVQYSITGYSESPFLALLLCGVYVGMGLVQPALSSFRRSLMISLAAGALIGLSGYFKGLDAAVAAISFSLYIGYIMIQRTRRLPVKAVFLLNTAFVVLLPLCLFTYSRTGSFTPGNKGGANFLLGQDWKDSKVVYAANPSDTSQTLSQSIRTIPKRMLVNTKDILRIFNEQLFIKGFRIGTMWFLMVCVLVVAALLFWERKYLTLPLFMLFMQLLLLSFVFVHDRILFPSLVWVLLMLVIAVNLLYRRANNRMRLAMAATIGIYLTVNSVYAISSFNGEFMWWRYQNIARTAHHMKSIASEYDRIMTYGPHFAVEFYTNNPLQTVEMPYGTVADVEEIAAKKDVRYILVSDVFRSHWPIAEVFSPSAELPQNWQILDTLSFDEDPEGYRYPPERVRIIERHSSP